MAVKLAMKYFCILPIPSYQHMKSENNQVRSNILSTNFSHNLLLLWIILLRLLNWAVLRKVKHWPYVRAVN